MMRAGWWWYLVGTLPAATIVASPLAGATALFGPLWWPIAASGVLAVAVGARRKPAQLRQAWHLLTAGLGLWLVGDVLSAAYGRDMVPGPASVGYLLAGALFALGLMGLARWEEHTRDWAVLIDTAIVTTGIGLIAWTAVLQPLSRDSTPLALQVSAASFPVFALLLVGLGMRLAAGRRWPPAPFWLLLAALGAILWAAVSVAAGLLGDSGVMTQPSWAGPFLWVYPLMGAAALHPRSGELTTARPAEQIHPGLPRLFLLSGAALTAAILDLMLQTGTVQRTANLIIYGLVLIRLILLTRTLARSRATMAEHRFRCLIQDVTDVITLVDGTGRVTYASPAAAQVLGRDAATLVGERVELHAHPDDTGQFLGALAALADQPLGSTRGLACRFRHADGSWRHLRTFATNLLSDPDVGGVVLTSRDETEHKELEARLRHSAFHDPLTDLANRALFVDRVSHALTVRGGGAHMAVLFVDLDDFKAVNDGLGHTGGDQVLVRIAARLREVCRPADTVARLGGDEFAVLLEHLEQPLQAVAVADRILSRLAEPLLVEQRQTEVSASIGIAFAESPSVQTGDLLRNADTAMYAAKSRGKNGVVVFEAEMYEQAIERIRLTGDLQRALGDGELRLVYQPILALDTGALTAVEGLVRWHHPTRGELSPGTFVPLAEDNGAIDELGRQVLAQGCAQLARWQRQHGGDLALSINVSPRQLGEAFPALVGALLEAEGLAPPSLILELTESAFVGDEVVGVLHRLRALGVRLAMDDFGTGFSALGSFRRLPLDLVKLDRSFTVDLEDAAGATLTAGVLKLAQSLGVPTVAEGIESVRQLRALQQLGCTAGQGYYLARPMPAPRLDAWMADAERHARVLTCGDAVHPTEAGSDPLQGAAT